MPDTFANKKSNLITEIQRVGSFRVRHYLGEATQFLFKLSDTFDIPDQNCRIQLIIWLFIVFGGL